MPLRKEKLEVYVSKQEKRIIRKNSLLQEYKSVSAFLRDKGLDTDISNKGFLVILLTYLNIHLQDFSPDKALEWIRKKQWDGIRMGAMTKFSEMSKDKYEKTLVKLEETITIASEMRKELRELLSKRNLNVQSPNI